MSRSRTCITAAAVIAATLLAVSPLHATAEPRASAVGTGTQLWVDVYDGPGHQGAEARAVAVDPVSGNVFVTGYGQAPGGDRLQIVTMAYSPVGERLWTRRYGGPTDGNAGSDAIAVDPVSHDVYVVGGVASVAQPGSSDFVTVAFSVSGARLWSHRYNGYYGPTGDSLSSVDRASSIAVDPANHDVYVFGISELVHHYSSGNLTDANYATVAYAADGTRLWSKRVVRGQVGDPGQHGDNRLVVDNYQQSLAVDPVNHNVYITGSVLSLGDPDYMTVAYSAAGARLWMQRRPGRHSMSWDGANAVAVDPGNHNVYVTGKAEVSDDGRDAVTVAYRPDGSEAWSRRFAARRYVNNYDSGVAVAVDTANHNLFVAGYTDGDSVQQLNILTLGYSADGLRALWARLWNSDREASRDQPSAIAVDSVNHEVVLTGRAGLSGGDSAMVTVSYDEAGTRQWAAEYVTPTSALRDYGEAVAVDETRHLVYAVGLSAGNWIVIAYAGGT